jgi:hypothetical protein
MTRVTGAFARLAKGATLPVTEDKLPTVKQIVKKNGIQLFFGKERDDADPLRQRQRVVNIRFAGRWGLEAVSAWVAENF